MKKNTLLLTLLLFAFPVFLFSQNEEVELTGKIIYNDNNNEKENPVAKAFDGDLNTYFNSYTESGNWIGYDLKKKCVITKVAYCPRMDGDYRDRLALGIFEGANRPDFSDAVPLFIIPGDTERKLNEQVINCSRGFRYVRFVFPWWRDGRSSYMAELKFFGYEGEGDEAQLAQLTNLPTISIRTTNNQGINSKDYYVKGTITVIWDGGKKHITDSLEIKGRGNYTWSQPKKPYRLKIKNKHRLLDLPANDRNWTIIANWGDKTLMRNAITFDYARRIEMPYTSPAENVDVIINGDYKGSYQLSDHVEIGKNRVDVHKMTADEVTGGYMVEVDGYASGDPNWFNSVGGSFVGGMPVSIKGPKDDEITSAQKKYIESHFNGWVNSLNKANYKHATNGYRKYTDLESFLRRLLAYEWSAVYDGFWSIRMAKDKDDDRFYFMPVWDCDLGFDNDWRCYPTADRGDEWQILTGNSASAGDFRGVVRRILSDASANTRLKEIYKQYRDSGAIHPDTLVKVIDRYEEYLDESQKLNFQRWRIMNEKVHENPVIHGSYAAEVEHVRQFVRWRVEWLDKKLNYVPPVVGVDQIETPFDNLTVWAYDQSIHLESDSGETFMAHVSNLMGQQVAKQSFVSSCSFDNLTPGVYLITVVDGESKSKTYKCIVQ